MRRLIALAVAVFLHCATDIAVASEPEIIQTHEVTAGDVLFLKLPGNPDQGYRWRLNAEKSRGLGLVAVDQIGWIMAPKVKSMFFQEQSTLNVSVKAAHAGQADLAFDYYRNLGGRIMNRTSMVRVIVKPKIARQ